MAKKYYKSETEKALNNFPFLYNKVNWELIQSIVKVKIAVASANLNTKKLKPDVAKAIIKAGHEVLKGKHQDQFRMSALQGGAGTSINMNINEVLASLAEEFLPEETVVHPLDQVNLRQSTNDVCPSALRISAYFSLKNLLKNLNILIEEFETKAKAWSKIKKLSRTHLQDAVPITLGQEFLAYAEIIKFHKKNLQYVQFLMLELNLGGTIVGNGDNTNNSFRGACYKELKKITGVGFRPAKNLMAKTSSLADFLIVSQSVVALGMDLSKISNDIRLMSSGPSGGLGELIIPELQKGSSIMPGKVNPVICELVNQWYIIVSGNNLMIENAGEKGQLELNVMFPVVADKLLESLKLSEEVLPVFGSKCIKKIKANKERCLANLENSTALAICFIPILGYEKVEQIVKESVASGKSFKKLILQNGISEKDWNKIVK